VTKQEMTEFVSSYMQANISFFVCGYQLLKSVCLSCSQSRLIAF
jgi:hypothetical protein